MSTLVVNTHEAKSRLSQLIRAAEEGTEVIVARNGQPVARIVAWADGPPSRLPGAWAGKVEYELDDLVGPDEEIAALFELSAESDAPPAK